MYPVLFYLFGLFLLVEMISMVDYPIFTSSEFDFFYPKKHSTRPCKWHQAYHAGCYSTKNGMVGRGGRTRGWNYILAQL